MKTPKELINQEKDKKNIFNKIDYKGKHFIIQDQGIENDEMSFMELIIGTITKQEALNAIYSKNHIRQCTQYGIPAYIGDDEEMQAIYEAEIHLTNCICQDCEYDEKVREREKREREEYDNMKKQ